MTEARESVVADLLASAPATLRGFPAFAPDIGPVEDDSYPAEMFPELAAIEERSFWFQSRNRILVHLFRQFVGNGPATVMEVGCGTGFVLAGLARAFPEYDLLGAEMFPEGLAFAKDRVPEARFCQLDATKMPFDSAFDAAGFFDVLEHLESDEAAMRGAFQALKPGGHLVITVPQHRWLWSSFDVASDHKRRYTRHDLVRKLRGAGFEILRVTSFVTGLLPAMLVSRLRQTSNGDAMRQAIQDLAPGRLVNDIAGALMRVDEGLIAAGLSLPIGGSLAVVAEKPREFGQ